MLRERGAVGAVAVRPLRPGDRLGRPRPGAAALVAPEDEDLMTCVRLDHYLQLIRGNLHLAINRGDSIGESARYAKEHVPFWDDEDISDLLADRSTNPL